MLNMIAGQKARFTEVGITQQFTVIDVACFGLDAQQKLVSDDYMTFYNQPKTPCGAIS